MNKRDVLLSLEQINTAKAEWAYEITTFNDTVTAMMKRLLHEAAAQRMSAEEVASASGFTVKRVRQMMRDAGLNPRDGKNLLSAKAAEALATNAALLGIEPGEMDLMSPLAYLPMGEKMKRELQAKTVSQVKEIPCIGDGTHGPFTSNDICHACGLKVEREVSGNPGAIELTPDETQLAAKLSDAGPTEDEAIEWVRRIIAARIKADE